MAGQIVSYNFTATLSAVSGSISVGDWLVKDTTGTAYVKATAANRALVGGYVEGISLDAASSGGAVRLLTVGPVPGSVTGLTSGAAGLIVVDSNGRTARYTTGDTTIVGWCYATGDGMVGAFPQSTPTTGSGSIEYQGPTIVDVTREPYGAVGDGVTDDTAAIQAAIDDYAGADEYAVPQGVIIYFPPGTYRITSTIEIRAKVMLMGAPGGYTVLASQINADQNVTAFHISEYPYSPDRGYGTVMQDLYITSDGGTDVTKHGIDADSLFHLNRIVISGFPGNGIYSNADIPTNTSSAVGIDVRVFSCKGRGIELRGGDANAQSWFGTVVTSCLGGGIYDGSFLGNHWFGVTLQNCMHLMSDTTIGGAATVSTSSTLGNSDNRVTVTATGITINLPPSPASGQIHRFQAPSTCSPLNSITISGNGKTINGSSTYLMAAQNEGVGFRYMDGVWEPWGFGVRTRKSSGAQSTVFNGLYIEADCGTSYCYSPAMVVGGDNYSENSFNGMFSWDSDCAILCMKNGWKRILFSEQGPSGRIAYAYPLQQTTGNFYTMRTNVDAASVAWAYQPTSGQSGYYYLTYNNNYLYGGLAISGARGTEGKGRAWFPRGLVISPDSTFSSGRHITAGSAVPTSSHDRKAWRTGDLVINSNGAGGQATGWRASENGGWASDGAWAVGLSIETGDTVTPSTPNGYVYRAQSEPSAAATGTATSGTEPTWPTTYGSTVTGADGIVWECVGVSGPTFHPGPIWQSDAVYVGGNVTSNTSYGVYCMNTAPATLTLEASPFTGRKIVVKGNGSVSGVAPLTISGNGKNIDGSTPVTLTNAYESATLIYSGSEWMRV